MGGIVGMPELQARNHLFHHIQEVLVRSLSNFAGRQGCSGVMQKERAEALLHVLVLEEGVDPLREVHNLLVTHGLDYESVHSGAPWFLLI
jgi:hypothetical protein